MREPKRLFMLLAVPMLVLTVAGTALAQDYDYPSSSSAAAASTTTAPATGQGSTAVLVRHDAKLGPILTDSKGRTLYLFENDKKPNNSTCAGTCATNWPAFTATGSLTLPSGVSGTLTTFKRADDGKMQVAYNGIPLYYFAADQKPGDTNGQDIGDVWYVVVPGATFGEAH